MKRYNDSKLRQVQAFFKLPTLTKESATDLQSLLEGFERAMQSLDQIVQPADYKDLLLSHILCSRLDSATRRSWEEHSASKEQDTVKDLTDFLQKRIRVLGSLPPKAEPRSDTNQLYRRKQPPTRTSHSVVQSSEGRCVACSGPHPLYQCPKFQRMTVMDRDKILRSNALCRNCFRRGHVAADCRSHFVCRNCKAKHHTMVCFQPGNSQGANVSPQRSPPRRRSPQPRNEQEVNRGATSSTTSTSVTSNVAGHRSSSVLLATAVIIVEDDEGATFPARALLDSGSECNFMSQRLSQRLKVHRLRTDVSVLGIGQANTHVKQKVAATVKSRVSGFSRKMEFLLLPNVTADLPTMNVEVVNWNIPKGIELADPAFFNSKAVDLVLGIENFFSFFKKGNEIQLGRGLPKLTESVFGWIVSGTVDVPSRASHTICNMAISTSLEDLLVRFWECEEVGSVKNYSPEERRCEQQFVRSIQRGSDGKYTVSLPKDEDAVARMGESRDIAFRRLQALERRLVRDPELRVQYEQFLAEYLQLGHMCKVNALPDEVGKRCYLPHHPVIKQESATTKVRVVFDASCKTSTGVSLNDALLVGPVIQDDLRAIILRCRTRQFMLVSDVEKMFRQINISAEDAPLQSILWRSDPKEEPVTYELTTVTYGTKPAPFLATRTLQQLALDEQARFPLAARAATEDVYMDDVLTGVDDEEQALELRIQLDALLESGGMRLRKWASNSDAVLQGIPAENLAIVREDGVQLDPDPSVRTLGLIWQPSLDEFRFQFKIAEVNPAENLTKRRVLSIIATLFDPLGLIGAVITTAKLFMQLLWCLQDSKGRKLDWDHPLPPKIRDEWRNFHNQLPRLNMLSIQRCVVTAAAVTVELHVFCDASERAYGACAYIRSVDQIGLVQVTLLTSKSKVAPLKCQSIPRLELCGALLAAQLSEKVLESIKKEIKVFFWTDSTCVLQWLKAVPTTWTTFVANRVAKIQGCTENRPWNHVPGKENPADLISRGVAPDEIHGNRLWWDGPDWLRKEQECWPNQEQLQRRAEDVEKEVRRTAVQCTASKGQDFGTWYIRRFPSYTDLIRRTVYWFRLMKILRKSEREDGFVTVEEMREAENAVIRRIQQEFFSAEWEALSKGAPVARSSPLRWFNPQLSSDNLIRVGGRLGHSSESEGVKHPIVLPRGHLITQMIFEHYHKRLLHAGPQLLLATVRQKYWPLGGRSVARHIVHQCHRCFRTKPMPIQQFMGELPAVRVTVSRPFEKTGVDYFGPIYVRPGPRRTAVKAYVALFVCMCTKAVHLEMVADLSTYKFLQALRRFVARRGKPTDIYSDNGTNFVGARNQLQQLFALLEDKEHQRTVARECATAGIRWHFNPPSAPHFGGLWEAAVRSAKTHLLKVLGVEVVSMEDMNTLLVQVEGCLNSRPLTAMSDDPEDLEPLTPGHFLTGASLQQIPDPDYTDIPMNRLKHWQVIQKRLQQFWKRWRSEYLQQLQGRTKRFRPAIQISVGQLVVIRDDNLPPIRWKMGRVQQVHPGEDGVIRVVTLKTSTGSLTRPVEKLCLLPPAELDTDGETDAAFAKI